MSSLKGVRHAVIPDRVEAGTLAIAVGAIGGDVTLHNVMAEHLRSPLMKLYEAGAEIIDNDNQIRIRQDGAAAGGRH